MNIQHLEYFIALAKSEHMTRTAQELHTSQPNLSYVISELEKELGVPLFKKNGRNIRLTKYGTIFYESASESLRALEDGYHRIQSENDPHQGTLSIGFIYTFGALNAPKVIKAFQELYPQVHFELEQNNSQHLLEKLNREEIELAMVSKMDEFDRLMFEELTVEPLVLVVPQSHPLAEKEDIFLAETMTHAYVYYSQHSGLRPYLDQNFANLGLKPDIQIELEDDQSVLGFVAQDFGLAIMPDIPSISSYPVKKLAIRDCLSQRTIYLASRQETYTSPVQELFQQFCLDYFKESRQEANPSTNQKKQQ